MMAQALSGWLVLTCAVLVTAVPRDTVLRFLSRNEIKAKDVKTMEKLQAKSTFCPNNITECSDTSTCCPLLDGQYGCCDEVNAVCCSDGVHCCPQDFVCDLKHGQCSSATLGITFDWEDKKVVHAHPVVRPEVSLTCRDNKTVCQANDTCCISTTGYGCCPLPHAVCCMDKAHCCPTGTQCDLQRKRCFRKEDNWYQPFVKRQKVEQNKNPKAVCCSDHVHCCPSGYTCNYTVHGCVKKLLKLVHSKDTQVHMLSEISSPEIGVVCPGSQHISCPDGNTCCALESTGYWGCCAYPNAVCCSDKNHCCPHDYTCDEAAGTCKNSTKGSFLPWKERKAATLRSVVCPGRTASCPDGSTCCQLTSGAWGCCPYVQAVCCGDHIHCCPNGYTCDVEKGTCEKNGISILWREKKPAALSVPKNVVCPDGQSQYGAGQICCKTPQGNDGVPKSVVCPGGQSKCADGQTCCKTPQGDYGCCPVPNAVCCADLIHCCPSGYTCDSEAGSCLREGISLPFMKKKPAALSVPKSVVCPGGQSKCADGQTCCKTPQGDYGCCPVPNAVCCADLIHCCPSGYTCDSEAGSCLREGISLPFMKKKPAALSVPKSVVCPGGQSKCADGQTCCKTPQGDYGCCPVPNAVCCADLIHCCPSGYTCDSEAGSCLHEGISLPFMKKKPAALSVPKSVVCPGGQSKCADGQTCCKTPQGDYGCCPVPNAVCCADLIHCCPSGYTCDSEAGSCLHEGISLPFMKKKPAALSVPKSVECPDGQSECADGQTCCKTVQGKYGCCPEPDAVCCSDRKHCCPRGYKCNLPAKTCDHAFSHSLPSVELLTKKPAVTSIICPDQKSECAINQTCCKTTSGAYGCCPYSEAECCADLKHCCPKSYKCVIETGKCKLGILSLPWEKKRPAIYRFP